MIAHGNRPPEDPETGAIWWATRRQLDPERFAQDDRFEGWLANPANAQSWEQLQARDVLIGSFAGGPEIRQMRQDALAYARAARPHRRHWLVGGAIAASLLAGLFSLERLEFVSPVPTAQIALGDQVKRFSTSKGERRDVSLSDGSKIALNTATIIEVQYARGRRDVRLLAGQALFHVAKDRTRPFVVAAGNRLITATGTAFDVAVEQNGTVKVLLVEGRVRVDPVRLAGLARLVPSLSREDLEPGQELTASKAGEPLLAVADVEQGTAWNRGIIILRDDTVNAAVAEFNRYSDRELVIGDPAIGNLKVSGVFPTAQGEDFVAALEAVYPVRAANQSSGIVLKWRKADRFDRP